MHKKLVTSSVFVILLALPFVVFAINISGTPGGGLSIVNIIDRAFSKLLWPLFAGFAVIMFIFAGFLFLSSKGDPAKITLARDSVTWGAIGVIVALISVSIPFIIKTALGV
ncbi:MAG: hypothetical protein A3C58_00225 [Candidatus Staskawiczbacteria bacterium RIFCSPHIGHO2_02_FULL_34_10]|uniref:Uncharacterized protein n=2 Tax=Candidatus Staskawicziibacteriota TaxID=1817916 RepID=A0A1G2HLD1_9BACT|nr:MAG: hypothetical protein A2639_02425 [Candidatus Staskawiczbacteria bacterium RIFCSPHIGHO2_01_FULL_34_27]OGZ67205.1 MAG: hypothetical protein A3C58_00225 [Candidatus Staskawiczbacteria bacterium RIFCSPHIGHO2_02_FULL_34_10]